MVTDDVKGIGCERKQKIGAPMLLVATLLVAFVGACGSSSNASGTTTTSSSTIPPGVVLSGPVNNHGTETPTRNTFEVDMYDSYFEPTFIELKAGVLATMKLQNNGTMPHTFTSSSLNINRTLQPGEKFQQWITPSTTGSYEFVCTLHEADGMRGAVLAQ